MDIPAAWVKKLREETDAPLMECKRALQASAEKLGGEADEERIFARAKEILREAGKMAAGKRAERAVSHGVVAVARRDNAAAAVVLLCETDFVARNDDFRALAQSMADHFASNDPGDDPVSAVIGGKTVAQRVEEAVSKIRENIRLGAVKRVSSDGPVGVYLHHDRSKAALVVLSGQADGRAEIQDIANKLGTQVVAFSPEYISKEQVDPGRLAKEIETEKQRAINEGKPAEVAEKVAQGRVNKEFLKQVVLMEQPWYLDLHKNVAEVLKETAKAAGVEFGVARIVRLAAGQEAVDLLPLEGGGQGGGDRT